MKKLPLVLLLLLNINAMSQNISIRKKPIDAIIISVYKRFYDGKEYGNYFHLGRYMYENGELTHFGNDSRSNGSLFDKKYVSTGDSIDEAEFFYDDAERFDNDYTHCLNYCPFEFISIGTTNVRCSTNFHESDSVLFAVYKYKGEVIEYTTKDDTARKKIIKKIRLRTFRHKDYFNSSVAKDRFYINYRAEKVSYIERKEVYSLFPFLHYSPIIEIVRARWFYSEGERDIPGDDE